MVIVWFHWWWDANGLARAQVLTGVVGVILAVFAILYAWRVALTQFKVMDEQTAISKRQMELAEKQDTIIEQQLAKRPELRVTAEGPYFADEDATDFSMYIYCQNVGRGAATSVNSMCALGGNVHRGQVNIYGDNNATGKGTRIDEQFYISISSPEPSLIFPPQKVLLARVVTGGPIVPLQFHILWRVHALEGRIPGIWSWAH